MESLVATRARPGLGLAAMRRLLEFSRSLAQLSRCTRRRACVFLFSLRTGPARLTFYVSRPPRPRKSRVVILVVSGTLEIIAILLRSRARKRVRPLAVTDPD